VSVLEKLTPTVKPKPDAVPKDVRERVDRGREAMMRSASKRKVCFRFYRGDQYCVGQREASGQLPADRHATSRVAARSPTGSGRPGTWRRASSKRRSRRHERAARLRGQPDQRTPAPRRRRRRRRRSRRTAMTSGACARPASSSSPTPSSLTAGSSCRTSIRTSARTSLTRTDPDEVHRVR
jgi:hypothetical protein